MSINRLQCPGCSAPLVPGGGDSFWCGYCGMRLEASEGSAAGPVATPGGTVEDDPLLARRTAYMHLIEQHNADLAEHERLRRKWTTLKKAEAEGDSCRLPGYASLMLALGLLIALYALARAEDVRAGQVVGSAVAIAPLVAFLAILARAGGRDVQGRSQGTRQARDEIRQRLDELNVSMAQRRERLAALEAEIDRATLEL